MQWINAEVDQCTLFQFSQTPAERFTQEQHPLLAFPAGDFDTSYHDIRQVALDGYIKVQGNRYSVTESWFGQPVSIRISLDDELRVYGDDVLIAHTFWLKNRLTGRP